MNRYGSTHQSLKCVRQQQNRPSQQEGKRQGDWICLLCNNLNYSFRDSCNRCHNLTRYENMKLSNKKDMLRYGFEVREPLGYLFFHRMHSLQDHPRCYQEYPEPFSYKLNRSYGYAESATYINQHHEPEKTGFSSLLFLTPTRYAKDNCYDDFNHSYESPKLLPSVSPLLRSLKI